MEAVAEELGASTASVRNWIKTGYLDRVGRAAISKASFDSFKQNVAGREKLTARANKSLKDLHDHAGLQRRFQDLLLAAEMDEDIGSQYEEALSNAYRNKEGIYYTPLAIAERFFQHLPAHCSNLSFCDPCCGSGNFILTAVEHGIHPELIYGYDTDPIAVELTKKRLFKQTGYKTDKVVCADFLKSARLSSRTHFDIIVTNPPWGKKINREQKAIHATAFNAGSSTDTSALFFFACLSKLNEGGYLGFLLPDAFFKVASFQCARKRALSLTIKALIDFNKPFKGLLTTVKGIIVQQQKADAANLIKCEVNQGTGVRTQASFKGNPKHILNFNCSQAASRVIDHLYQQPHLTLSGWAQYGLGIVTGNNKRFCISEPKDNYIPVYKGSNLHRGSIDKPSLFIPNELSLYQQVAPRELFLAPEKLIYRFISSKLVFYQDCEQRFFLNSINMLVLDAQFPINTKELSKLLNSEVINWLFKSVFDTYKVLRSDIEALPIHTQYFDKQAEFTEALFLDYLGLEQQGNGAYSIK